MAISTYKVGQTLPKKMCQKMWQKMRQKSTRAHIINCSKIHDAPVRRTQYQPLLPSSTFYIVSMVSSLPAQEQPSQSCPTPTSLSRSNFGRQQQQQQQQAVQQQQQQSSPPRTTKSGILASNSSTRTSKSQEDITIDESIQVEIQGFFYDICFHANLSLLLQFSECHASLREE